MRKLIDKLTPVIHDDPDLNADYGGSTAKSCGRRSRQVQPAASTAPTLAIVTMAIARPPATPDLTSVPGLGDRHPPARPARTSLPVKKGASACPTLPAACPRA